MTKWWSRLNPSIRLHPKTYAAINSWERVWFALFWLYLVVVAIVCVVGLVSPRTIGLGSDFSVGDVVVFILFGAISYAWWGIPIFFLGEGVIIAVGECIALVARLIAGRRAAEPHE